MVQIIERSDIFGKIGQSFGKGLGEVAQKETQRGLLRKDLGSLRENLKSGASPLDLAGQLLTMRGIDPGQAMQLMPLFQQEMVREQAKQRQQGQLGSQLPAGQQAVDPGQIQEGLPQFTDGQMGPQQVAQQQLPPQGDVVTVTPIPKGSLRTTPEESASFEKVFGRKPETLGTVDAFKELVGDLKPPSPEYIDSIQDRLMTSGDMRYVEPAAARQRASDIANQEFEEKKALANKYQRQTAAQEEFESRYNKELKGRSVTNIPNEYASKLFEKSMGGVLDGKISPIEAAKNTAKKALELDKKIVQIQGFGSPGLGGPDDSFMKELTGLAKPFREAGMQELVYNTVIDRNDLGRRQAGLVAYGLSKDNMKAMSDSKGFTESWLGKSEGALPDRLNPLATKRKAKINELSESFADNVIPTIDKNTTIGGLGLGAIQKGLDDNVLYDRLREMSEQNPELLTVQQKQELENITPVTESLGEVWDAITGTFIGRKGRKSAFERFKEYWGKR